ncbi:hypothetical protein [Paenarthrobacter nitroguajacolicus]|uniref:hypothetical protein n=1 Tax=Paenarthrobacter nitroguajacolicus TaxID=211146 RepID=UPI00248C7035|nr:hypothetical protein [Paenarthrobacter nitroguajacolicus]MDI2036997.1 hypothetical protein [Paenarthrobacter nitroguajacolicus]
MNKNALRGFAVSGLLVMGLTACSGPGTSTDAASAPASETATPTPTQVEFRTFSKAELTKIVGDVRDAKGTRLMVMPDAQMADTMKQVKDLMGNSVIEPAACTSFLTGGGIQMEEGATMSIGASASSTAETAHLLSLFSGASEDRVKAVAENNAKDLAACGEVQMTVMGEVVHASVKAMPTSAKTPGAIAYHSTAAGTAGSQEQLFVSAVKSGVVLVAQSAGTKVLDSDLPKLEAMLDDAAELIK